MHHEILKKAAKIELAMEAILNRQSLDVVYNGKPLQLQPHQLFVRHDAIYVKALNLTKSRRHDEDHKLGEYNIAGLTSLALGNSKFDPLTSFNGQLSKNDDRSLVDVASD